MIKIENISKSFGRKDVLKNISFDIPRNCICGIVGENGSGKTTLLKILTGLLKADAGLVNIEGTTGYCPQENLLFPNLTIRENLCLFTSAYRLKDVEDSNQELLKRFDIKDSVHKKVVHLSGGTQQKLNLIIALIHDPDILLLDEPYAAFDWNTYLKFWEMVEEFKTTGKTCVIVSHFIHDQAKMDHIFEIKDGRIKQ